MTEPAVTEEEFLAALETYVAAEAPSLFALCREIGDREGGQVKYWGLEFDDQAGVFHVSGDMRGSFCSAESALDRFSRFEPMHLIYL